MGYDSIKLKQEFQINQLFTVHYFEYMNDFSFPGESHDFWEFLCVDKGEVQVTAGEELITLKKGEIIFHKPLEFHSLRANGVIAPNLVVISFSCHSPNMKFFEHKKLEIGNSERALLASIIEESKNAFSSILHDPYLNKLTRHDSSPFGSEQLVQLYLEQLLILLYRRYSKENNYGFREKNQQILSARLLKDEDIYNSIHQYLETRLNQQLTIEQICRDNLIGRSQLQKLFRDRNGCGIIDYFSNLKIDASKQLIREKRLNFTQISEQLGYSSVHYFSRQFKKNTGMAPSEYASSIKLLAERPLKK